jgi:hypothetical protein
MLTASNPLGSTLMKMGTYTVVQVANDVERYLSPLRLGEAFGEPVILTAQILYACLSDAT